MSLMSFVQQVPVDGQKAIKSACMPCSRKLWSIPYSFKRG